MAQRSWWAVAGVAAAVLLTVGTAVTMTAGDAGSGPAGNGAGATGEPRPGTSPSVVHPTPSVVAPRDQTTRPDVPLTLTIESYEVLEPDRLQIRYATGLPECYGSLDRAVVKEADHEVALVLVARPPTGRADQPCPDIALLKDTVVRLDAPLGDRRVIDGVSGRAVPRGNPERQRDLY